MSESSLLSLSADAVAASSRTRLLRSERDRLEKVLLSLPGIVAELDRDSVLRGIGAAVCELTRARFALFVGSDRRGDPVVLGPGASLLEACPVVTAVPLLAAVLERGETVRIDDVRHWASPEDLDGLYGAMVGGQALLSWLGLPVFDRGQRLIGALYLGHHRARAFSAHHELLARGLATHLGASLETAEVFAERTRVAIALQDTLLPPLLPLIPGLELATCYRPSGTGNLVGGDFYDVFSAGESTWYVMVGDVSCVGLEAAGLTGIARYTARALGTTGLPPKEVMVELNRAIFAVGYAERFCTAVLARVRPREDSTVVELASGGHPPPFVLRKDGAIERVFPDTDAGTLLGIFAETVPAELEVTLRTGDALVIFTDGVTEARNATAELFGDEGLSELLAGCKGRSADGIARRIDRALADYRGNREGDDVAVFVVRAHGRSS